MIAKGPEISGPRDWLCWHRWNSISIALRRTRHQLAQLDITEASQRQVKAQLSELHHLAAEQVLIPAGIEGQAVVSQHIGAPLRLGPASSDHDRYLGNPKLLGRKDPAMAGNDTASFIHEHRIGPAPLLNGGSDLGDLRRRMRTGVAGVGHELGHGATFDAIGRPGNDIRIGLHNASSLPPLLTGCKIDIIAHDCASLRFRSD